MIKHHKGVFIPNRADPFITRADDGKYYFTASVPEYDGIRIRAAESLEGLSDAEEKELWHKHDYGAQSIHIWAPELHFIFGAWYIYYAAGDKDDIWRIRPYVIRCTGMDPVNDSWEECGQMQGCGDDEFSFTQFSLDGTVLSLNDRHYFIWAEKVGSGKQISNLYIAEMESPVKLSSVQVLLSTPDYAWERSGFWVNEGPAVLVKGSKIYLCYSASDTGVAYCMGMLSCNADSNILDPQSWTKEKLPVLSTDEAVGIYGPGHNSFTVNGYGEDIVVFHGRTEREIEGNPLYNPNRHTMLMKLEWSDTGRPVFRMENILWQRRED